MVPNDRYLPSVELDSATNDSTILYYKYTFITHRKDSQYSTTQTIAWQKYARANFFYVLITDFGFAKRRQNFANTNIIYYLRVVADTILSNVWFLFCRRNRVGIEVGWTAMFSIF